MHKISADSQIFISPYLHVHSTYHDINNLARRLRNLWTIQYAPQYPHSPATMHNNK